jgi:hypothetical protein
MSSPPQPLNKVKPKPRQKTVQAPESDTTVKDIDSADDEVVVLECEMEQERL